MPIDVKVPTIGESIASGILSKWHVADGESVKAGQTIYDLETDKVTSEATAEAAGILRHRAAEGDEVAIGQVVAVIEEGSAAPAQPAAKAEAAAQAEAPPTQAGEPAAAEEPASTQPGASLPLSPAARRVAEETGIDPTKVKGTGKDGRVTKGDLLSASAKASADKSTRPAAPADKPVEATTTAQPSKPPPPDSAAPAAESGRETRTKMTPLRARIAQRLVEAQSQAALLTTFNEVDMSGVMALRKKHQEAFTERHGIKLGFMSFFVKAVVAALRDVPALNARIDGDAIIQNHYFDIGVAVSTERGLLVPVVRGCDRMSFADVEKEIGRYAKLARDNKIQINDLQGGVFTITNGGIFGSLLSTPIINPPQSGILGMHSIKERPVVVDGQIVIRPMMYLALTYDHRLVDGREAVTFLVKIKDAIEDPSRLLFDV